MTAPLTETGALGAAGALAAALLVGIAFGWCLERAGLGNARKLVAQFYLTDLAVFKVMFSAIVTAMLGAFWLSRLGVLDLSLVHVPETWLLPQLAGGAQFGVGMATAGLCPGTACVSAATGRGDGLAVVAGFLAGVLLAGAALPRIAGFFTSTARGVDTLPARLGVSQGAVVLLIVALALAGFAVAGRIERARGARRVA
ncbi:YeeE/YedE thiosulfate transporter family protein [Roseisolibacter agri]|uniref:YeeE/YedE thiosulfate transporter family protein n=1 Tax=Roseisolibacter agri TaxID=2014610 RepID=UPI0024E182CF|nr:YeeE/YedE thiosulfate transporter family protein [Roseisolibacter agri]